MYPVQLCLVPSQDTHSQPQPDDLTQICLRARQTFPSLEHIRIRLDIESIMLTAFIAADSATAATTVALDIARHIVSTETAVRGWRCATE